MQSNPVLLSEVKQYLLEGQSGEAISRLKNFLQQNGKYPESLQALEVIEANYNATRTQELKAILGFQEAQKTYNQINDSILNLIRDLESGKDQAPSKSRMQRMALGFSLFTILISTFTVIFVSKSGKKCPKFEGAGSRVLILPFHKISGEDYDVAKYVQGQIQEKTQGKIPVNVKIWSRHRSDDIEDPQTIRKLVKDCNPNVVIWGSYTNDKGGNPMIASRHYVPSVDSVVFKPFQSAFSLDDDNPGQKKRNKEDVVFSVCTVLAILNQNMPLAMKWMDKTLEKNDTDQRILNHMKMEMQR